MTPPRRRSGDRTPPSPGRSQPVGADPARRLAFDVLRRVHADGAYANLALAEALVRARLEPRQAGLATELVAGTCRGEGTYDRIISAAAGRELGSLQPAVVDLLRLGTHQLLALNLPSAIAVSSLVDLAAATVGRRVTGVVNAILRQVATGNWDTWMARLGATGQSVEALAIRTCHPTWIAQVYYDQLGAEAETALLANNQPPQTCLALRPGLATADEVADSQPGRWSKWARLISGDPGKLAVIRQGRAGVEDEGSQLIAIGLARLDGPPGIWLDLCAGPGGKAALLAGLARQQGERVMAAEISYHRAQLVAQAWRGYTEATPTSLSPLLVVADGRRPPWAEGSFSRVLADVPCSGLGALRRRPDARWRKQPADLATLVPLQRDLLRSALASCRPGGVVAYATCSPHPAETVQVVEAVLAEQAGCELIPAASVWPELSAPLGQPSPPCTERKPGGLSPQAGDYLQLWPHRHGTDAMFCALIRTPT